MILFQQRRAPILRSDLPLPRYVLLGSQHHKIYRTRAPPPTHPTHRHPPPTDLHHKNKDEDNKDPTTNTTTHLHRWQHQSNTHRRPPNHRIQPPRRPRLLPPPLACRPQPPPATSPPSSSASRSIPIFAYDARPCRPNIPASSSIASTSQYTEDDGLSSYYDRELSELQNLCDAASESDPTSWDKIRLWLRNRSAEDARAAAERRGDYETTPLHLACRNCPPLDIVNMLLTASPRTVELADSFGWLPLHYGEFYCCWYLLV